MDPAMALLALVLVSAIVGLFMAGYGGYRLGSRAIDGFLLSMDRMQGRIGDHSVRLTSELQSTQHLLILKLDAIRLELLTAQGETRHAVRNVHTGLLTNFQAPELVEEPQPATSISPVQG